MALPLVGERDDPLGFARLSRAYFEWMATKGYTLATVHGRVKELRPFFAFCAEREVKKPAEVTRSLIERYQRRLFAHKKGDGRPLGFIAQRARLYAVRAFFRYLVRQNLLLVNPAAELELPRVPKRLPKYVLSAGEAERVLAVPDLHTPRGLRDRALLEVLYSTGIRRAEVAHLDVYGVDLERKTVMIREGKGRKDRVVPFGGRALAWLTKYLTGVRPLWAREPDDAALFLSHKGERLDADYLTHLVRRYVKRANLGKGGGCHLFRHTVATLMLENGADVRFIQAMLGHARLETTQLYTRVSIRALQQVHAATHPAERRHAFAAPTGLSTGTISMPSPLAAEGDGGEDDGMPKG